jgi:nicotinamide mononucleotide transporter
MTEFIGAAIAEFNQNTWIELSAVILAVAYLLLAVKQNIACWYAAFVSTAIFLHVFWQVHLYMEAGLQVFYLVMAVYGWHSWRKQENQPTRQVITWPWQYHVIAISIITIATLASGYLLSDTNQRLGYIDSFTTWGAVVTTIMVVWKILENWLYWLVIDSVAIYLYLDRELYFTALLFAVYIVIIFFGYFSWRRDLESEITQGISD